MTTVFLCEDSLDGILTGVDEAWDSRLGHENVRLQTESGDTMELFCEYRAVPADLEKAGKVLNKMTLLPHREVIEQVVKSAKENDLTINALREEFLERQDIADERMDENGDDFYVENS